jgi:ribonuclease Z
VGAGGYMLDVCLLGTGGMMPLPDRWLTSILVRSNGRMILIDCGEGTQIPIKRAQWGFKAIDVILFTHYHADHIAGLPGLLLTIGNSGRVEPLTLVGPIGLKKVVEGLCVISPELPFELELIELPSNENLESLIADISIKSIPVDHNLPCFSYSIELKRHSKFDAERASKLSVPMKYWKLLQKGDVITLGDGVIKPEMVLGAPRKGIKVCYCTDTRPTEELAQFIREADLFICEGMYGNEEDAEKAVQKKHMMFSEAGLLAKQGTVKELWLTHYSPSLTEPEKYIDSVREVFTNTYLGQDLFKKNMKWDQD